MDIRGNLLHVYDFLSRHRVAAIAILVLALSLCAAGVLRLHYDEDISAFLPMDERSREYFSVYEELGGQDRIAFIFSGACKDSLKQAMSGFFRCWEENDRDSLVDMASSPGTGASVAGIYAFMNSNIPLFLEETDYARMDSLLADPGYVEERLQLVRRSMFAPSAGFFSRNYRSDPLDLFSPVFRRLSNLNPLGAAGFEDGFIFSPDGRTGVIFIISPFGGSESGLNAEIAAVAEKVARNLEVENPGIDVIVTGGPVVAAGNASRIKKDSFLALGLALVLICVLLFFSYRRFADIFFIMLSIICGALFSLGIISLFKPGISLIILGIGSVIMGIAVNYPLHYIDHLKFQPDKRKALEEQTFPLIVGNVTTVGAFLSLLLMKSDALRDFGFIGAMLLVGTIVFTVVFLPALFPVASGSRKTLRLDSVKASDWSPRVRTAVFTGFAVLTVLLYFSGGKVGFDSDLHGINYMTEEQERGFAALEALGGEDRGERIFVVNTFSKERQEASLDRWKAFLMRHPGLGAELADAAASAGFTRKAFEPFLSTLGKVYEALPPEDFDPFMLSAGRGFFLKDSEGVPQMVSYVHADPSEVEQKKEALRHELPDGSFCFSTSDVSGRLASALSEDFDTVGVVCSLLVFVLLCLSLGSLELGVMAFIPLAVSWVWILGIMGIAGWQFNVVNVILASFIFGQGDDYTIFMTEGLIHEYATGRKILHSFRNSVTLSALLMFIGIGVLVFARHPAMRSLGEVTVVGMLSVVMMARYLPPVIFRFLTEKKGRLREIPVTFRSIIDTMFVLLVFLAAMLVLTPAAAVFFLLGGRSDRSKLLYHSIIQSVARISLKCIPGVRHTLANPHGEKFLEPAVIVCNHQSHIDVLSLLSLTPKMVIMTNDWVWNNPFYGFLIRKAEFYPVSDGFEKNIGRLESLVKRGYSVAVFPEGTRSEDCSILRFHQGAASMAGRLGLDILPVFIHGFGKVLPKKELMLRRLPLYTEIGERITAPGPDTLSFTRDLRHMYVREYSRICREREGYTYASYYLKHQYIYKGRDVESECREILKCWTPSRLEKLCCGASAISVENAGSGALALLISLLYPEIEVRAYCADENGLAVASHCVVRPSNLHFYPATHSRESDIREKIITL